MTTLRDAVLWCCRLEIPWTAEDVAQMAGTALPATRAYLMRQERARVIKVTGNGNYMAGDAQALAAFRATKVNPKPGGNSAAYRRAKEARDRLLNAEAEARRNGLLTRQDEPARDNPRQPETTQDIDPSGMTKAEAAARFRVTVRTIDRWIAAGVLGCFLTPGNGRRRIPISELYKRTYYGAKP